MLDAVGASVVEINVTSQATRGSYTLSGTGSGFVVDASGLILTNQHVIESASDITVQFSTGDERSATLEQGYLGISIQETTNPSQSGLTVTAVEASSDAAAAGLRAGDVITAVGGTVINGYDDLAAQLAGKQPGAQVTLTIQRDQANQQVVVTLQSGAA